MSKTYTEEKFESAIEHNLIKAGGYIKTNPETFDRQLCLDPTILLPFIQKTQPKEWEYLKNIQKEKAEETFMTS
jgi:type I restriction enzyme R subunit